MPVHQRLADADLRRALAAMVRRRVPPHEVDEIVQATLADAVASKSAPAEDEALERWVRGIARHKVADYHRRNKREVPVESEDLMTARVTDASAHDAADLLRWAEREAKSENEHTIDWLLREGDGEKLESIAQEAKLPAARVRQRVSRLRRHFRARWAAQIAAALALGALLFWALRTREPKQVIAPVASAPVSVSASAPPSVPLPEPPNPAIELRRLALEQCANKQWQPCLDGLDEAAKLDPAGDTSSEVQSARKTAKDALAPPPKVVVPKPAPKSKGASKKPAMDINSAY